MPITFASAFAVWTAHEPASPLSDRCTALSAPIDSALRIASAARSGPMHTTVTSPPFASLSCSAASTARSSISSRTASEASRSKIPSEVFSFRSE